MSDLDAERSALNLLPPQALSLEEEERRRQLTLEALADVDAGNGLLHDDVKAWASRLPASR